MERRTLARRLVMAVVLVIAGSGGLQAQTAPKAATVEYSATMIRDTGGRTRESRIFYTPTKLRTEIATGQRRHVAVIDQEKKEMLVIDPDAKTYMKMTYGKDPGDDPVIDKTVTMTKAGRETIDGVETTIYDYAGDVDGIKSKGRAWVTKDNIALKTESTIEMDGKTIASSMHLTDLRVGKQDKSLFEAPAGYRAVNAR